MSDSPSFEHMFPVAAAILAEDGFSVDHANLLNSLFTDSTDPRAICLATAFRTLESSLQSRDSRIRNLTDESDALLTSLESARADLSQSQTQHQADRAHATSVHETTVTDLQSRLAAAEAAAVESAGTSTSVNDNNSDPATTQALERALQQVSQLSQEKSNLLAANASLQSVNTTLQSSVTTLSQAVNSGPAPAASPRLRGTEPTPFSGDEQDSTKRHFEYLVYRGRLRGMWFDNPLHFSNDTQKISYAQGHLTGSAFLATSDDMDVIRRNPKDPSKWKWATAEKFLESLDNDYIVTNPASLALGLIQRLAMAGKYKASLIS